MGRTWPNVDAETVIEPGYYWNAHLRKLARLGIGEKLPKHVGAWEMVAPEGEKSSSEVARQIFDRYPNLDINDFTYTTTSPLGPRLPIGDYPPRRRALVIGTAILGGVALGAVAVWAIMRPRPVKRVARSLGPRRAAIREKDLRKAALAS